MKFLLKHFWLIFFIITVVIFALPFWAFGKLPIPSDALVGLYHPFRDNTRDEYPNGIPFKNPLITDVVLQQYPYRLLAMSEWKRGQIPKWNPYAFSGTPLMANIQSGAFYPLNFLFFFLSDEIAWSILVLLQPILAGIFCFWYLKHLGLNQKACVVGSLSFAFSGFMTAWFTWNTLGHVALWIPLILLTKDKLITRLSWVWVVTLIVAESAMIFAGHLQTAMYVILFTTVYLFFRTSEH